MKLVPRREPLTALFPLIFYVTRTLAQTCYFTDGTVATDFVPCNSTASATTCCGQGAACLTSGLCYLEYDATLNAGACTDKTWKDANCFQGCDLSPTSAYNTIFRCNVNEWCCSPGGDPDSCCNATTSGNVFNLTGPKKRYGIYNGSAWAPGFTVVPVSALVNATVHGDNVDQTAKVGVGVGAGIGLPLLAALISLWVLLAREKRRTKMLQDHHETGGFFDGDDGNRNRNVGRGYDQEPRLQEMPAIPLTRELPGAHTYIELT